MYPKFWFPLLAFVLLFKACTPAVSSHLPVSQPEDPQTAAPPKGSEIASLNPYAPVESDQSMVRGDVQIDSLAIMVSDSFPPQYQLEVKGSLPSPCHDLRAVVNVPTVESAIHVQIYSVYDPYTVCTQEQSPFGASLPLGGYVRGSYKVFVNENQVGEITP